MKEMNNDGVHGYFITEKEHEEIKNLLKTAEQLFLKRGEHHEL